MICMTSEERTPHSRDDSHYQLGSQLHLNLINQAYLEVGVHVANGDDDGVDAAAVAFPQCYVCCC